MIELTENRSDLWKDIQIIIHEIYKAKEFVYPDGQDAASFTVQEATEIVDIFLRRKSYKRNNKKPNDKPALEKEIAQTMLMLFLTAYLQGINPLEAFHDLFIEYKFTERKDDR